MSTTRPPCGSPENDSSAYQTAFTFVALESLTNVTPPSVRTVSRRCGTPSNVVRLSRTTSERISIARATTAAAREL